MRTKPKLQRHVLRQSLGAYEGSLLTEWLNQPRRTGDHRRIERLLVNLSVVFSLRLRGSPTGLGVMLEDFRDFLGLEKSQVKTFDKCLKEVQTELEHYRMRPILRDLDSATEPKMGGALNFDWDSGDSPAARAILLIMSLGNLGLVQRVRHCRNCKRWFYAKFSHNEFCSTKCQQAHYKSSPQWREQRKKYMRQYRKLTESGAVK
jgi:hypothetical protein